MRIHFLLSTVAVAAPLVIAAGMPAAAQTEPAPAPASAAAAQAFKAKKVDEDLIYQANFGNRRAIEHTLARGANPNAKSPEGWPAVSLTASRNDPDAIAVIEALLKAGADINVRDTNGETPLMNAIVSNNLDMVRYLLAHGADFRAINTRGRTVLEFAEHYGNSQVSELVRTAIEKDDEEIREGRSQRRFHRILSDFIYYHCVLQYVGYNLGTHFYREEEQAERAKNLQDMAISKIQNAQVELEHNFRMQPVYTKSIGDNTQKMMYKEMEELITNRNRRNKGVGTETDLDTRCKRIVEVWRGSYAGYETDASRTEPGAAPAASPAR